MTRGLVSDDDLLLQTEGSVLAFGRTSQTAASRELPLNLRDWVEPSTLFGWVLQEVEGLAWENPRVLEHLRRFPNFRPKTMLTLLAYGYVTQIFNSQEIVARCRSDRALSLVCENQVPFPEELTQFRRKNRPLIAKVLAGVFCRAMRHRFDLVVEGDWVDLERAMEIRANARLDVARHMDIGD